MEDKIKTPEIEKIPALCDEWLEHAKPALETLELAREADCGYKCPPYPRFMKITRRLVAWCRSEADEIDPSPLDELATELIDPWHVALPSGDIRKLWEDSQKALMRIQGQAKSTDPPAEYLLNWRQILIALGYKNNREDRESIRNLNDKYNGPIIFPGQGKQPKVDKAKLFGWWERLEIMWTVGYSKARDTNETVSKQHDYGRDGSVIPDISGSVKKRRSNRQK